jgi:hypothetical protein
MGVYGLVKNPGPAHTVRGTKYRDATLFMTGSALIKQSWLKDE